MKKLKTRCPAEITVNIIGGRWKLLILYHLFQGVKRFSELQRSVSGITQKMLTQQLREMERDGLVHREIYPQVPPKVEYSLTPLGESLRSVVDAMSLWGKMFNEGGLEREALRLHIARPGLTKSEPVAQQGRSQN